MSILKDFQKYVKAHHVIALLGVLVLVAAISQFSSRKGTVQDGMSSNSRSKQDVAVTNAADAAAPAASAPMGQNEVYASASGMSTSNQGLPPSCTRGPTTQPGELLPKDENSEWAKLNPSGSGNVGNVNLLKAGFHAGIDTVGSSLRNANLQVRSEPPNPTTKVSPWGNTTIEPDLMRVPLELGCGPQ